MDTNASFFQAARKVFPSLAKKADRHFIDYWDEQPSDENAYSWFHSVANALNEEMRQERYLTECSEFFDFVALAFDSASEEVKRCIDVSFVENLFWQVPPRKSAAYWNNLPPNLQTLYAEFHHRTPLA
jgi:hypothetical protein